MIGVGSDQVKLFGWSAAGGMNPVGIYTFNTGTLTWEPQAPISSGGGGAVTIADGADVAEGTTGDAPGTNTVIGKLKEIALALVAPLAVTGTFFQATQPVSIAGTVAVSAATLPLPAGAATSALQTQPGIDIGDVTINNAAGAASVNIQDGGNSITVDGAFFQVTQPVSAAALPLPAGASTEATLATRAAAAQFPAALIGGRLDTNSGAWLGSTAPTVGQKTMANSLPVVVASDQAPVPVDPRATTLSVTVTGGANAIATATLPAAGAGLFHYITHIFIKRVATAALAGGALLTVTSTNLGGRAWRTGNQASITVATHEGAILMNQEFTHPIKSAVANTATTIVGPAAGAAVSWHIVIDYFTGV